MAIPPQEQALVPIFMGFCAKAYCLAPEYLGRAIAEVCSASDCFAARPANWIERWDFNSAFCWNTEAEAWAAVTPEVRKDFRLYAYRVLPLLFDTSDTPDARTADELFPGDLGALPPENALKDFAFLGYDVVQGAGYMNYGCSPLSCNNMAQEYPANPFCLLDDLPTALQAAAAFGKQEPEPGPFLIYEVWRKQTETQKLRTGSDDTK